MKGDPTKIPSHIFDWLEQKNFSSLSASQQEEVLLYFSKEDYEEMHQAVSGIRSVNEEGQAARKAMRKADLLQRFDTVHKKNTSRINLFQKPVTLWKAAAVFLLFGSAAVYATLVRRSLPVQEVLVTLRDTVYVMQEVKSDPVHIFDTVYLVKESVPTQPKRYVRKKDQRSEPVNTAFTGINVLSVKEIDNVPNQQKHTSIKDDTLVKKFSFVSVL